ncbi:MAG: hypothetical protein KGS72_04755 [Cyanobacteria bacterium REEB67]|nr:hypothetical protein [Cyanobacteria bacterium REEB67]
MTDHEEALEQLNEQIAQLVYDLSPDEPFASAAIRVVILDETAEIEGKYDLKDGSVVGMELDEDCFAPFQEIFMLMIEEGQEPWKVALFSLTVNADESCIYDLAFEYEDENKWAFEAEEDGETHAQSKGEAAPAAKSSKSGKTGK